MARYLVFAGVVVVACGGAQPPTQTPVSNAATTVPPVTRDEVIRRAWSAMEAGDLDGLMSLADLDGLFERALACNDDTPGASKQKFTSRLRDGFADSIKGLRGAKVELTSIDNEVDVGEALWGNSSGDSSNAAFLARDGRVSSKCTARTDLMVHEARVGVRATKDGKPYDRQLSVFLLGESGRWHLVRMPGKAPEGVVEIMEDFTDQMCACKDKACAEQVQDEMTKWGTKMAKSARREDRPDPEVVKRTTEIMGRYVDCMTKLMMANNSGPTP